MTAEALEGDRERFLDAGMDDYVPKPIMMNELTAALVRSVSGGRSEPGLPESAADAEPEQREPIDISNFEDRLGPGSSAVLAKLADLFIEEAEPMIGALRQAADNGNWARLESLGHRLSGSSSNVSALRFAACCQRLRQKAKEQNQEDVDLAVTELEQEYERIKEWRDQSSLG
jgi:HPt (histidine-containing phosphotransfer) domain-containing protein